MQNGDRVATRLVTTVSERGLLHEKRVKVHVTEMLRENRVLEPEHKLRVHVITAWEVVARGRWDVPDQVHLHVATAEVDEALHEPLKLERTWIHLVSRGPAAPTSASFHGFVRVVKVQRVETNHTQLVRDQVLGKVPATQKHLHLVLWNMLLPYAREPLKLIGWTTWHGVVQHNVIVAKVGHDRHARKIGIKQIDRSLVHIGNLIHLARQLDVLIVPTRVARPQHKVKGLVILHSPRIS